MCMSILRKDKVRMKTGHLPIHQPIPVTLAFLGAKVANCVISMHFAVYGRITIFSVEDYKYNKLR